MRPHTVLSASKLSVSLDYFRTRMLVLLVRFCCRCSLYLLLHSRSYSWANRILNPVLGANSFFALCHNRNFFLDQAQSIGDSKNTKPSRSTCSRKLCVIGLFPENTKFRSMCREPPRWKRLAYSSQDGVLCKGNVWSLSRAPWVLVHAPESPSISWAYMEIMLTDKKIP
jgi:hypothetical protein